MPVGFVQAAQPFLSVLHSVEPKNVLDIGVGYGFWGSVIRNYISADPTTGEMRLNNPIIDGVEVFPRYRNPVWNLYNHIYEGNIDDLTSLISQYDLVVCIDVIEHLDKDIAKKIMTESKAVAVGISTDFSEQNMQEHYGNKHEKHISLWNEQEVKDLGLHTQMLDPQYIFAWRF